MNEQKPSGYELSRDGGRAGVGVVVRRQARSILLLLLLLFVCLFCFQTTLHRDPPPDGCEGPMEADAVALLSTLHTKVNRLPGDTLKVDPGPSSWQMWKDDPGSPCAHYRTMFGVGVTPVVLVSVPGSGSTWLRYLLEAATGVFTGSDYNDTILYQHGFLGEKTGVKDGSTIVQRTHGPAFYLTYIHDLQDRYEAISPQRPTILLLRDPARTIISYWKLFNLEGTKNKHVLEIPKSRFEGGDFHDFVSEMTAMWEELASDRLLWTTGPLYVIHYEDLVRNTLTHLRHLLHFLNVPVDEGRLACVASHLEGDFKRNTTAKWGYDPFTADEKLRFATAVKRVNRLLTLLQYPQLPPDHRLS